MKHFLCGMLLCLWGVLCAAQDLSGKWYGKISQGPGGYSTIYDFDVSLVSKNNLRGESDAYIENILKVRILLSGKLKGDSVILQEKHFGIMEELVPPEWTACIKNIRLKYSRENGTEFLKGSWGGISKDDFSDCIPGRVILTRNKNTLEQLVSYDNTYDNFVITGSMRTAVFETAFKNTEVIKTTEIEVKNDRVTLELNDYLRPDNDTVSVFLNRVPILEKVRIARRVLKYDLYLDKSDTLNEILIFAENLGAVPPNTSQLLVRDGDRIHRVKIESDKQKSAAVYLKYTP